jgi:hypothetical protein
MVGFRARSSVQRVAEPRYLRASCQRVSPEVMRIDVALPPALRFGATSRFEVVEGARAGRDFGDARGMVASVSGYLLRGAVTRVVLDATRFDGS